MYEYECPPCKHLLLIENKVDGLIICPVCLNPLGMILADSEDDDQPKRKGTENEG